ncbi:MAG TPA: 50S ribosomal protein L24 [Candidatus Nanoarchaeia archaeon]|nr:50S ribosomal protein L24 [Candidatus Nanoarchaeia archaeon]
MRKQRKYRYNAPLHIKQKMLSAHLSKELRTKYGTRNIPVRKGDTVKVSRGQFKKKQGKVERVILKQERVFVAGIETIKRDGSKVLFPLNASNLIIIEVEMSDKRRKEKLEKGKNLPSQSKGIKQQNAGHQQPKAVPPVVPAKSISASSMKEEKRVKK